MCKKYCHFLYIFWSNKIFIYHPIVIYMGWNDKKKTTRPFQYMKSVRQHYCFFLHCHEKYIFFLPPPPPLGLLFMPQFILQRVKRKFLSDAK